ncbi:hypothetical protein AB0L63_03655 [Nocardia sp. NPDC051990]|uniref:hypothetical protein n=1 Tax=Nocardia sp. NPDC051990 TaxID=3155285 RepID=UPI003438EEEC
MATEGLAPAWRQLLEKLGATGMLADCEPPAAGVSGLDAVSAVLDRIHASMVEHNRGDTTLNRLVEGRYDRAAGVRWLVENYHFTKSASYHISPVFGHEMSSDERKLWTRFLEEESWHWRIYRPAGSVFGLGFDELDAAGPRESTRQFVELIRAAAVRSPVAYAATLAFIEKSPASTDVADNLLLSSLMKHYGFTSTAVRPLWWHQLENATAGHNDLSAIVISNRQVIDAADFDDAIATAADVVRGSRLWYDDMFSDY